MQSFIYSMQCFIFSMQCAMFYIQYAVCSVQCLYAVCRATSGYTGHQRLNSGDATLLHWDTTLLPKSVQSMRTTDNLHCTLSNEFISNSFLFKTFIVDIGGTLHFALLYYCDICTAEKV